MQTINCIATLPQSSNKQPVWIDNLNSLFWVDDRNHRLYEYNERNKIIDSFEINESIISIAPRSKNGFIACLEDGIGFYDLKDRKVTYISKPEPFAKNYKTIAGVTDNFGNYWSFTQPQDSNSKNHGNLYKLSSNLDMQRLSGENWLCTAPPVFSSDGKKLYQSCGSNRYIYMTTLNEQGQPESTVSFCRISKSEGYPHGLCIDEDDNVWVCHRGIGLISKYSPEGSRIDKISIPTTGVKYCTFGGKDLDTLFIITSTADEPSQERKKIKFSDALLSIQPGATGLKINRFSG